MGAPRASRERFHCTVPQLSRAWHDTFIVRSAVPAFLDAPQYPGGNRFRTPRQIVAPLLILRKIGGDGLPYC
jgi:hypothetical protein